MILRDLEVLYVCTDPGISWRGSKGAAVHVREICECLARECLSLDVLVARDDGLEQAPDVPVHRLASLRESNAELAAPAELARRLLRETMPHLIWERYSLGGSPGLHLAVESKADYWLEINAPLIEEAIRHRGLAPEQADEERLRLARQLAAADVVIVVSQSLADYALENGARSSSIHVMPNGFSAGRFRVNDTRESLRRRWRLPADAFVVVFAGGFRPWHGIETLLAAFERLQKELPKTWLVLAGEGPSRSSLQWRIGGLQNVLDPGHVPADDLPFLLAACDVGVSSTDPTAGDYFCPLKILEYQASGLAVVSTDLPAARAAVDGGQSGVVLRSLSAEELCIALCRLATDPSFRRQIADAGHEKAWREGTWDRRLAKLLTDIDRTSSAVQARAGRR